MNKEILILPELSQKQLDEVKKRAPNYQIINEIEQNTIEVVEIVFGWENKLRKMIENDRSKIGWIQYPYAGVNHLPLGLLKKKDIQLTTGSGTNAHAVAESTMALILGITRNIVEASKYQAEGHWFTTQQRYELKDKTILIVGAGKIGEQIGRLAQAFLMKTIGINRSGREINYMDEQYLQADLPEIVKAADIIVNILPATKETYHLFNSKLFSKMKESVIFVNVGRGETVSTEDLLTALDTEEIAWAALDVFEEEPLPLDHPLWAHEKVLMTPHIAGQVENQLDYIFPIFLENLEAYLKEKDFPLNYVEFDKGY